MHELRCECRISATRLWHASGSVWLAGTYMEAKWFSLAGNGDAHAHTRNGETARATAARVVISPKVAA